MTDNDNSASGGTGQPVSDGSTEEELVDGEDSDENEDKGQMTFYLREDTQYNLKRWLSELELDYREVFKSDKADQYEAIVQVAMDYEDEVVEKVKNISTTRETSGGEDENKGQMTFYLREETQYDLKRWLRELELDYREVFNSERADQYESLVQVAMENEEEVVENIKEISVA